MDDYNKYKNLHEKKYPEYIKKIYKEKTGKNLNLNNPKNFSEKLQWIKLYDNLPIKTTLTDKLKVRNRIQERTDALCYPEIYGSWDSYQEIDFSILPQSFFLKTNHGCSMNIRVEKKDDFLSAGYKVVAEIFDRWLNTNYAFVSGFELQYKDIVPKVYAEEKLIEPSNQRLSDFKIWCFDGKPAFIEYFVYEILPGNVANSKIIIYDTNWIKQEFSHTHALYKGEVPKPKNLSKMIRISEELSKDFKFVRVDLYEIDGKLYFAEMTFTPCSGHMIFNPLEYDRILGDMLILK